MSKGHTYRNRDKRREQKAKDRERAYKRAHNFLVRNMGELEQRRAQTRA
jgi:hypothetical protein